MKPSNFDREFARTRRHAERVITFAYVASAVTFFLSLGVIALLAYWATTSAKSDLGAAVEWLSERWHAGK